jgi:hypothetical protein
MMTIAFTLFSTVIQFVLLYILDYGASQGMEKEEIL